MSDPELWWRGRLSPVVGRLLAEILAAVFASGPSPPTVRACDVADDIVGAVADLPPEVRAVVERVVGRELAMLRTGARLAVVEEALRRLTDVLTLSDDGLDAWLGHRCPGADFGRLAEAGSMMKAVREELASDLASSHAAILTAKAKSAPAPESAADLRVAMTRALRSPLGPEDAAAVAGVVVDRLDADRRAGEERMVATWPGTRLALHRHLRRLVYDELGALLEVAGRSDASYAAACRESSAFVRSVHRRLWQRLKPRARSA